MFACKLFILIFILSKVLSVWTETPEDRIERIEAEHTQYLKRMRALNPETTTYKDTTSAGDDDLELVSLSIFTPPGIRCPEGSVRFGASCRIKNVGQ